MKRLAAPAAPDVCNLAHVASIAANGAADAWLQRYHHRVFARLVHADGCVSVNRELYYLSTTLASQKIGLVVDALSAFFEVIVGTAGHKRLPIKSVLRGEMPAIFPLGGTDDAFEKGQCSFTWFRADKTRSEAGMETFEFLTPSPDFDDRGPGSLEVDGLRWLHRLLLSAHQHVTGAALWCIETCACRASPI